MTPGEALDELRAGTADPDLDLFREMPADEWPVYETQVGPGGQDGHILIGKFTGLSRGDRDMLRRFVNLAGSGPHEIAAFAAEYGSLRLCRSHQMPRSLEPGAISLHWPRSAASWDDPAAAVHDPWSCGPAQAATGYEFESTDVWRFFSTMARSILRATTMLRLGQRPPLDLWREMGLDPDAITDHGQMAIADLVSWWLRLGGVRVALLWRSDPETGPELAFTTATLFAGLGMQLAAATAATPGRLAFCRECGALHRRGRAPQAGRDTYCETCSNSGAAQRAATRRLRQKNRTANEGDG